MKIGITCRYIYEDGIEKQFVRRETEKKLVFCKWIKGGVLPSEYVAAWNLKGQIRGQLNLFDFV